MFTNIQNQQQKQDMTNVHNVVKTIQALQKQPEFHNFIQFLQQFYLSSNNQLDKSIHQPLEVSSSTVDSVRHRSEKIILKNHKLKEKIFLIRAKLDQIQNFSDNLNTPQKFQERQNIEKTKLYSTQIKAKILALKQKNYIKKEALMSEQDHFIDRSQKRVAQKVAPLELKIEEMKKGVEYMSRSLTNSKYDIEELQKYLKSCNLRSKKQ